MKRTEIMVTRTDGVLLRCHGEMFFERFFHRSAKGRTGRGDTTFGSYFAAPLDQTVADSLRLAVAVVSMKTEAPGPFTGTAEQILERLSR